MTLDDLLAALWAVALVPDALTVQRARHALEEAPRWSGWDIGEAVRDAALAVDAWDRARASEAAARTRVPAPPGTGTLHPRYA